MDIYQIADFTGGLNRFIDPSFLQPNEARVLHNIDIATGVMKNVNGHDIIDAAHGGFFLFNTLDFTGTDRWEYHEKPMVWYELTKTIYKSALGRNLPVTAVDEHGAGVGVLGVSKPTNEPTVNQANGGGVFFKDDVYNYVYTYVRGSAESQPSTAGQVTITHDGNAVDIITPLASAESVDFVRLYRMGGGSSSYLFIHEFAGGSFTDTLTGAQLGSALNSFTNEPPPHGMILDTEFKSMLVGHIEGDNVLRFSKEIYVNAWSSLETITLDSTIIRVTEFNGQLLVLCTTAIYRISGTNIDNFTVSRIPTEQGCLEYKSVIEARGLLFWQSDDGICAFDGAAVTVVSINNLPKEELTGRRFAAIARDENVYFADATGILALDTARNLVWREFDSPNAIRGLFYSYTTDIIYSSDGNVLNALFNNPNKKMEMKFKTGEIVLGSLISFKLIKKMYVFGKGRFTFQIKVDGNIEVTDVEVDLDREPKEISLPAGTKGRMVEILMVSIPVEERDDQKINAIMLSYETKGLGV